MMRRPQIIGAQMYHAKIREVPFSAVHESVTQLPENARGQDPVRMVEHGWENPYGDPFMQWDNRKTNDSIPPHGWGVRGQDRKTVRASLRNGSVFCDSGQAGNAVHKTLPQLNEFFCTKLISEHTKCGHGREALRIYKKMREEGVTPKTYTFVAALKACSSIADLEAGKEIHAHVIESGNQSNIFVANTLIDMYAKCGSMADARQVFERMLHHDVVSWNTMIRGYAQEEMGESALELYDRMQHQGFKPDSLTFVAALKACVSLAVQSGKQVDGELMRTRCLAMGRSIHSQVAKSGCERELFITNTLVGMYVKCGSMVDAYEVFEKMSYRDVVSWNVMIMGYAQREEGELALQLYTRMQHEGVAPDAHTFVAALKACGILTAQEEGKQVAGELVKVGCLEKGRAIHSQIRRSGFEPDIFISNTLVAMYVKCGSMVDACKVFEKILYRDAVSWNAMITGYAQREEGELALQLYARMQHEGFTPDARTFVAVLKACGSLAAQEEGKQVDGELVKMGCLEKGRTIHSQFVKSGVESDVFVATTLVDMYAKCGSMVEARQVFERMTHRNVVSWTAMIMGYAQMEKGELALQLYERMQHEGFTPHARTFVAALKACSSLAVQEEGEHVNGEHIKTQCLEKGRAIHSQVAKSGFELDIFVASTLVDMYAKCGSMIDARQIFERMPHRDLVSWTAMIMGYAQREEGELALQLFAQMQCEGFTPNAHSFVAVLMACGSLATKEEGKLVDGEFLKVQCLEKGRSVHSQVTNSGLASDVFVASTLVDMYAKCGSMVDACHVFENMPCRNVVSWTAMIMGYAQIGKGESALQLYDRMQQEGYTQNDRTFVAALKACGSLAVQEASKQIDDEFVKIRCLDKGRAIHTQVLERGSESDIFIANTLMDMYVKCGSMVDACQLFERTPHRDLVSWNVMIMGYAQRQEGKLALQLYAHMQQEGFSPDAYTFVGALMACGSLGSLEIMKEIYSEICTVGLESDAFVATCLLDTFGRCGSMIDAQRLFDASPVKDVVQWNALISGYSRQGDSERVLHLFEKMQQEGIKPIDITFVSVLTVCSHSGLVDMGQKCFQEMCLDYGITPSSEHYNCMVDLLGRAGQLEKAVAMVKEIPCDPDVVTWMTTLGACRKWNNIEVGRHAFECVVRLDEKQVAAYVMMTNIYASAHMWEEGTKIQEMRTNSGAWKKPGQYLWTDSTGIVHTFWWEAELIPKTEICMEI